MNMSLVSCSRSSVCRTIDRLRPQATPSLFSTRTTLFRARVRSSRFLPCQKDRGVSTIPADSIAADFEKNENKFEKYKASLSFPEETHNINELSKVEIGTAVIVHGYLGPRRRISKKLTFQDVLSKDLRTAIQVVCFDDSSVVEPSKLDISKLPLHSPVVLRGFIAPKEASKGKGDEVADGSFKHTNVELRYDEALILNEFPKDVLFTSDKNFGPDERHLELRASHELRKALRIRSRIVSSSRSVFSNQGFIEVETPLLFKSTPEGAREFLVPTRQPGKAYALPQSPQQYKQILMASGIPKYYQFARCFRDEDSRADRQPEFTQIDYEMAFADEADIRVVTEELISAIWRLTGYQEVKPGQDFLRLTYEEAMSKYGSDKPDLRIDFKIHDATTWWPHQLLPILNDRAEILKARVSSSIIQTQNFVKTIRRAPELLALVDDPKKLMIGVYDELSGLLNFSLELSSVVAKKADIKHGDLVIMYRDKLGRRTGGWTIMGRLRLALHELAVREGLLSAPSGFKFAWITDFPLFSPIIEGEPGQGGSTGISSTHHPFTAPKTAADLDLLDKSPLDVKAAHYDLVVNGVELGGGSRRIHDAHVQEYVLRSVLGMSPERVEDFRHLLNALKTGCPPHAGIALGLDRLVAVLLGYDSVRSVIAFPKNNSGEDLLVKSPSNLTESQLRQYHLKKITT